MLCMPFNAVKQCLSTGAVTHTSKDCMAANLPFLRAVMGSMGVAAQSMSASATSTSSCSIFVRLLGPGVLHAALYARSACGGLSAHDVRALSLLASVSASDMALSGDLFSLGGPLSAAAPVEGVPPLRACFPRAEAGLLKAWVPDEACAALRVVALRIQSASSSATDISCCALWCAALSSGCLMWTLRLLAAPSHSEGLCCIRAFAHATPGALRRQDCASSEAVLRLCRARRSALRVLEGALGASAAACCLLLMSWRAAPAALCLAPIASQAMDLQDAHTRLYSDSQHCGHVLC